jgi:hypothetical protein
MALETSFCNPAEPAARAFDSVRAADFSDLGHFGRILAPKATFDRRIDRFGGVKSRQLALWTADRLLHS